MKKIITLLVVVVLTATIQALRPQDPPSQNVPNAAAVASETTQVDTNPEEAPEASQAVSAPQPDPVPAPVQPETCRSAIAKVWPAHLQAGAITVMTNENRQELPSAKGAVNADAQGSQDFGCFQINDYWHPAYFAEGDWSDPVWAAEYAYKIYQGRQASEGNGWRAWYAVEGILW